MIRDKCSDTSKEPDTSSQTGRQVNFGTSGELDNTWKEADIS